MNELVREIEEDIRRERVERLWARFGRAMVIASIVIILSTIAFVVWQNYRQGQAEIKTTQMMKAIDRFNMRDYKGAIADFEAFSADKGSAHYGIAMLRKAQAEAASGNKEAAAKTYRELAGNDEVFGALGAMMAPVNAGKLPEPDKDSPFYYTQSESRGWQLAAQGKKNEAVAVFSRLRDDLGAPVPMRHRMQEAINHIAPGQGITNPSKEPPHE